MKNFSRKSQNIVFNLYRFADDVYLPEAFLTGTDEKGNGYITKRKINPGVVPKSDFDEDILKLFQLAELLSQENLEKKFVSIKHKNLDLQKLLKQDTTKKLILKYINEKLDIFIKTAFDLAIPLCSGLKRESLISSHILHYDKNTLQPQLYFERTGDGLFYRLQLFEGSKNWTITGKNITVVNQNPAWILYDKHLFPVQHINAIMLKPFLQKEAIFIPSRMVKTYFEKFILNIAKKVDIEAEGFDMIKDDTLMECRIEPFQNIFNSNWELTLNMAYKKSRFYWHDKRKTKTQVEFSGDNIILHKTIRDFDRENEFVTKIKNTGLKAKGSTSFVLPDETAGDKNPLHILEWLMQNKKVLEENGFTINEPLFNKSKIILAPPQLQLTLNKNLDWFDVNATVTAGEFKFPFAALKNNILNDDPYFHLPGGEIFIIPSQWMTKYKAIFKFAGISGDRIKLDKSHYTLLENLEVNRDMDLPREAPEEIKLPTGINATLRPYQEEGAKWLINHYHNHLGALLSDDMGLGKTLQTLVALLYAKNKKMQLQRKSHNTVMQQSLFSTVSDEQLYPLNALIIMPASLTFNWVQEIKKFIPSFSVYSHTGAKRQKSLNFLSSFDIIVTTYQTALRDVDFLKHIDFEYIILDESQQIKNRRSKIFNAIMQLKAKHKISLSGTPIENSLSDLWSQMQFLNKGLLGNYSFFEKEFIKPIEKHEDKEKTAVLKKLVKPFVLRRTKEEVEKNLPPLLIKTHYSIMTEEQSELYEREKSKARNYLLGIMDKKEGKYKLQILQVLNKLRQLANHPSMTDPEYPFDSGKFRDVMYNWETITKAGHKVLIFSSFVKHLNLFAAEFDRRNAKYCMLTGEMPKSKREQQIALFEESDEHSTFLISIKAGGTGLNLTRADYVFILDPWWNPATEQQAIARAHRIGQDKKVIAVKYISKDTLEEKILLLQEQKSMLAGDILGKSETLALTKENVDFILK